MDAPRGWVEFEGTNELQRLRRRAYGPDADIAGDAVAQARLSELEAAQRRELTPPVDAAARGPAAVSERVPVSEPVEGPRRASTSVPQPVDGEFAEQHSAGESVNPQPSTEGPIADAHPINEPPAAPWWRRRRGLVIVGGAITALALIAAVLAWISQPLADESTPIPTDTSTALPVPDGGGAQPAAPDAVLQLVSIGADAEKPLYHRGTFDLLGLNVDELRQYQDLDGIKVWSGKSRFGMVCLFVILDRSSSAHGCSAEGLEITAEMEWNQNEGLSRYVLKGDHVAKYTYVRNVPPQG